MSSDDLTLHTDGSVTVWNIYDQRWIRLPAAHFPPTILATLSDAERECIADHASRHLAGDLSASLHSRLMRCADALAIGHIEAGNTEGWDAAPSDASDFDDFTLTQALREYDVPDQFLRDLRIALRDAIASMLEVGS
jgi:hypothetical protein